MKIVSAHYVKSIAKVEQIPSKGLPEIAFAGRSNVGKSSLINCMLNRKKLALTSSSPGKTRYINFFEINETFYFVDLPGYGYAKVSQAERNSWKRLIESYLTNSVNLRCVIQIIDSRIGPTDLDLTMIEWLTYIERPLLIVATKIDKLPQNKAGKLLKQYSQKINLPIIPFSAIKKTGRKELWQMIQKVSSN